MAAWVKLSPEGVLEEVRLACGPAGPKPFRADKTEKFLVGKLWSETVFNDAAGILGEEVSLRTSAHRATKTYRQHILPVLLQRVIETAIQRANP